MHAARFRCRGRLTVHLIAICAQHALIFGITPSVHKSLSSTSRIPDKLSSVELPDGDEHRLLRK